MPAWALKLASLVTTLLVFVGSLAYTTANAKNPAAPLHPPVAADASSGSAMGTPSPSTLPALVGVRRGNPPRSAATTAPRLTLQPGVQTTALPAVTFTHVS
jgi:hypothetical protein